MAHYQSQYNNAFWNGDFVALGDGDQVTFRELTSLDIIVHELTHGVTDFTSDLIYQNESGALNEAFSDIMAASAEFYADDPNGDGQTSDSLEAPGLEPDWHVGEDVYIPEMGALAPAAPGFRNMADPEEDGDPDHYSELYIGSDDNGGVHTNSGIPNHAYYLLVNGGLNAGCDASGSPHGHCPGGGVDPIELADAERIFFLAFTALNWTATMCDARLATEATALSLTPITPNLTNLTSADLADRTTSAWVAVGLTDTVCPASGPYDFDNPTVGFVNPADGADVSGRVAIEIEASDNVGVALVQFFVDNRLTCESATSPLTCMWNTKKVSLGQHTLRARASDATGNVADEVIAVTVLKGGGGGGGNSKPTASFTYSCTVLLVCDFDGNGSSDSDGTIASYDWDFGEGGPASGAMANHTYASSGLYTVTLTVIDDAGASGSDSQPVSVGDGGFWLTANGFKVKGVQHATLNWGGASGAEVIVYRDEAPFPTTSNDGAFEDNIGKKGGGSYFYQVCEIVESPNCSDPVEVVF